MRKQKSKQKPLLVRGIVPGAAVASSLLSPLALGATGDLDPAFADLGRLVPEVTGPAWSVVPQDDGTMFLSGGDFQPICYYWGYPYVCEYSSAPRGYYATNFVNRISETGSLDSGFEIAAVADTQVVDIARQADGGVVAVGRKADLSAATSQLLVFRLQSSGEIDTSFAQSGFFELSVADHGNNNSGQSMVLDSDGRIVVAGSRDDQLIVLRLLPNGSRDDAFASSGVYAGPDNFAYSGARTHIVGTAGGYRISATNAAGCQVVALTTGGILDSSYGDAGISTIDVSPGQSTSCTSMAGQPDGRLLLAGNVDGQGFATRLLADGQSDPSFSAIAVSETLAETTALAVGEDGSIVVAVSGEGGTSIMRLLNGGELDTGFGKAGSTLIDLPSDEAAFAVVHDMAVGPDGSVLAGGGVGYWYWHRPFIVRLLGAAGGNSPGVIGFAAQGSVVTSEPDGEAVVKVRRSGGDFGSVSVAYKTVVNSAAAGRDYVAVQGRLTWDHGVTDEQEIRVAILSDDDVEDPEFFSVQLSDAQGGAGLGTRNANVSIDADGAPFGQFSMLDRELVVNEGGSLRVNVLRNYHSFGEVSVTLTPVAGSASPGQDFAPEPVTLTWVDGDASAKFVEFAIPDDTIQEGGENFTVQLSNPAGGAVIGGLSSTRINITASDQPRRTPETKIGGAGAFEFISLLLLGLMRIGRLARTAFRARAA